MAKTAKALWIGPYEADLPDGTHLVPGETVVEVSAGEAEASDHWEVQNLTKKTFEGADK